MLEYQTSNELREFSTNKSLSTPYISRKIKLHYERWVIEWCVEGFVFMLFHKTLILSAISHGMYFIEIQWMVDIDTGLTTTRWCQQTTETPQD